jgi:putative ABC transport system permease protein
VLCGRSAPLPRSRIKPRFPELAQSLREQDKIGLKFFHYVIFHYVIFQHAIFTTLSFTIMFANYLLIALRTMRRRTLSTTLNIAGLALGLVVFVFLAEFSAFHWGFDRFHANADRLYRIVATPPTGPWNNVPPIFLTLPERVASVEAVPALMTNAAGLITYKPSGQSSQGARTQAQVFKEDAVAYANNAVFSSFTLPLKAGRADLDKPNTMVISASAAQKYFGCGADGIGFDAALGKSLRLSNQFGFADYAVTGVMADVPEQSHLAGLDGRVFLASLQTLANPANLGGNKWAELKPDNFSAFLNGYALLKSGVSAASVEEQIEELRKKISPQDAGEQIRWRLQPVTTIHLGASFTDPLPNDGALRLVAVAGAIALFVLALAWMNYVSLSTAFGMTRAREIGVRKAVGASRKQLVAQHLTECALLMSMALLLALALVELLQVPFNDLVGTRLSLRVLATPAALALASGVVVLGTLIAGGYVALVLTGVETSTVLRGNFARSARGSRTRTVLVVAQFAISIAFIIGTVVVFQQLEFMRNRDLGMNLEQMLVVDGPALLDDDAPGGADNASRAFAFKQEAARLPFVRSLAGSQNVPGKSYNFSTRGLMRPTGEPGDEKKKYAMLLADENYFRTYGMSFAAGVGFKTADNLGGFKFRNVVVNEAAARQFGFRTAQEAVGAFVQWGDLHDQKEPGQQIQICGVVKNYHHKSLRNTIDPVVFLPSEATGFFSLKISTGATGTTGNVRESVARVEALYKRLFPDNPFTFSFADEMFQKQYEQDTRIGKVFGLFTVVAIVIACLGLLGLVTFVTQQRTKEIGIRKVLGASVASIVGLVSKDFLRLVAVAVVLATPLAYWLASKWLQNFAYRIELGALAFVASGVLALVVAGATVGVQAWRAARTNPVESLRSE